MPANVIGWTVCSLSGRSLLSVSGSIDGGVFRWVAIRDAEFGLSGIGERDNQVVHYEIEGNAQDAAKRVNGCVIGIYAVAEPPRAPAACSGAVAMPLRLFDAHNFSTTVRAKERAQQAVADGIVTKTQAEELWARGYFEPEGG